jgi:hypothetical protein
VYLRIKVRTEQQDLAFPLVFLRVLLDLTVYQIGAGLPLCLLTIRAAIPHVWEGEVVGRLIF